MKPWQLPRVPALLSCGSIHPQGWVPIETIRICTRGLFQSLGSIHPQGWVPIETPSCGGAILRVCTRSIHPQGWVPIETQHGYMFHHPSPVVAFTPKGGCPLKRTVAWRRRHGSTGSIHPQGWVPIETREYLAQLAYKSGVSSIHPQGWVPIETPFKIF